MEHHVDPDASAPRQRDQRLRDRLQPLAPAFAPMAGDQQATAGSAVAQRWWRQPRLGAEQGIDPGVAGHMHLAADLLRAQDWPRPARSERTTARRRRRSPCDIPPRARAGGDRGCEGRPRHGRPGCRRRMPPAPPRARSTYRPGPRADQAGPASGGWQPSTLPTWACGILFARAVELVASKSRRARTRAGRVTDAGRSAPGAAHGLARPVPERRVTV